MSKALPEVYDIGSADVQPPGGIAFSRHDPPSPRADAVESVDCSDDLPSGAELMALRLLADEYLKEKEELKIERDELRVQLATAVENHKTLSGMLAEERRRTSHVDHSPAFAAGSSEDTRIMKEELIALRRIEAQLRHERTVSNLLFVGGILSCLLTLALFTRR